MDTQEKVPVKVTLSKSIYVVFHHIAFHRECRWFNDKKVTVNDIVSEYLIDFYDEKIKKEK